ncbi:MAG: type III-A CRISPR-associated RAMP protein Csm3 [bacterium]
MADQNEFYGKILISGIITLKTGLHIGRPQIYSGVWGLSGAIIRDELSGAPYIPGSSLKGALRSLLTKAYTKKTPSAKSIHSCTKEKEYHTCPVCNIFGMPTEAVDFAVQPGRLIVRDAHLTPESTADLLRFDTEIPYTQVKREVALNRVSLVPTVREIETVPAGAEFGFEFIFTLYAPNDLSLLNEVFLGMRLLEEDYLGGGGSRGLGQIRFGQFVRLKDGLLNFDQMKKGLRVEYRSLKYYQGEAEPLILIQEEQPLSLTKLKKQFKTLIQDKVKL